MSLSKFNIEVVLYRLDAIERRLDNVEKHLNSSGKENPDLIKILLELIKAGPSPHGAAIADAIAGPPQGKGKAAAGAGAGARVEAAAAESDVATFDSLACMARRRTVV
jgi:hypothetical protein